jgi:dTDP-4-dehydrorhamnose reductase
MSRTLITGGKGMLARALEERAPAEHELLLVDLEEMDVAEADVVRAAFDEFAPEIVIHCAALTDVDGCETHPDAARRVNVQGARNVAAACGDGVRLVHISTDFVFDGDRERPYTEEDAPAPISVYGATKLEGEQEVRSCARNCAVVRTAWTFAPWGRNFVLAILAAARERGRLTVVDDQAGSPTYAPDLAGALWELAEEDVAGVLHLTNAGVVSRYQFACEILAAAGMAGVAVEAIRSAELARAARRPAYSALASTRRPPLRHYREALHECVRRLDSGRS